MTLAPGVVVADRFRLVRPLGQGGMGAVWLGQQVALDVPCAIKFIHEEAAKMPELRARFEREAKAAAQLRSAHVVHILDHGLWEGAPYIAMELLEGEDLEQRLARCRVLPPRDALTIIAQVGRALAKAHGVGLVHRDLKPANIFITRDDDREIAKVLDFGVAKVKETIDGATKTGAVLGTPYYMSPEQARGSRSIDHRSDLWALAVVAYQCLTGQLPFTGEALGDLFMKIIVEPLPMPSHFAHVPPGFDAWWARAASRDPNERFQNAKDFTESLSLALGVSVVPGTDVSSPVTFDPALGPPPGGTVAMMRTPQQAISAFPRGATPYPGGPSPGRESFPSAQSGGAWQPAQSAPGLRAVTSSGPTPSPHAMSTSPARPSKSGGAIVAVLGVLVLAGVGVGAFFALRSSGSTSAAEPTAPASAVAAAPAASSAAPVATASAAPTPSSTAAAEAATAAPSSDVAAPENTSDAPARAATNAAPAPPRAATHGPLVDPRKTAKEPAAPAKPNCNPPFTIDATGAKHAKPECL